MDSFGSYQINFLLLTMNRSRKFQLLRAIMLVPFLSWIG